MSAIFQIRSLRIHASLYLPKLLAVDKILNDAALPKSFKVFANIFNHCFGMLILKSPN